MNQTRTSACIRVGQIALTAALLAACDHREPPTAVPAVPAVPSPRASVAADPAELFFSEYIEGSSNNKALEIYNGTSAPIDLAANGYNVQMFFNGSASAGLTINLNGTVAVGDVFVLAQSNAVQAILDQADQTNGAGWFNGNDVVVLRKGTTVLDVIAQIGFNPGTEWGSGLTSTADNTLRRKSSVCAGDVNGQDAFDPTLEWDGFATDTFDGLGVHIASCSEVAPSVASVLPADGATGVAIHADLTITFSEAVNVSDNWFAISCTTSGVHNAVVIGGPTTFTLNPDSDFASHESCTVSVRAAGVSDQDAVDPPDNMDADFSWSFNTVDLDICQAAFTPIYTIQGNGLTAPLAGQMVTTQGIVVGDYEGPSPALRGFYLQDATGDGDASTSDGIFVFNFNDDEVNLGDVVRVTGRAEEFQEQTQLGGSVTIVACGCGATVQPVDVTLPFPSANSPERYEGMLVRLVQTLFVTEHFQLGRFGQVVLSSGARLVQPTHAVAPGGPAQALQAVNNLNRIIIDDGGNEQNPDTIRFGRSGNPLSAANTLRGGDNATSIVGVMTYTWAGNAASGNAYRVRPVHALGGTTPNFSATNPRSQAPAAVGGTLRVAALNLLNYFNTFSNCTNGVGGTATDCRGAESGNEFDRQVRKTVPAISAINADILGVIEIENDGYGPQSAIADLVNRLNVVAGAGTYAFIDVDAATGQVNASGTDAIKVGLIYKPASVTPVGTTAVLNSVAFVNGGDSGPRNRPSLTQAFQRPDRGQIIINVNHFKSKGSACDAPDAGDGQGNCNIVRRNAAQRLLQWLATDPTRTADPDVLIIGDLNSYAKEDPIQLLRAGGYTDLVAARIGAQAYSFVFDGQWGYLDYALASPSLAGQVSGITEWHINADEPNVLDYNTNFKGTSQQVSLYNADPFRIGDHDPLITGLTLKAPAETYQFRGFFGPVNNLPTENVVSSGRAVPLTFSLGGFRGLNVFDSGYPKSVQVSCDSNASVDDIEETASPGQSELSYNAAGDTYTFVWSTQKDWANTCRELVIRFADESVQRARFRFRN
jgi:uncharacterized protein